MAQKSKRKRSNLPRPSESSSITEITEPVVPPSRIRRTGAFLFQNARDAALQYFWALVGGVISPPLMATLISIILYLRSPNSAWAYAFLKYALIFLGGTLFPVLVLFFIGFIRAYQRRVQERRKVLKYASTEKAWVDYLADLEPAFIDLQNTAQEIGKETISVGARSAELITALHIPDPRKRQRMLSKGAASLNKHCQKMERASERLASVSTAALDASEGVLKTTVPASQGNRDSLIALRVSLDDILRSAATVIENQKQMIETARAVHGQVSMDVNTSMNWLSAVCEQNVNTLEAFHRRMSQNLFPELQGKLNS